MNSQRHLAVVTSADLPDLFGGEKLLPPALLEMGAKVSVCIWDDPTVQWQSFDAVIIRCPWDYHEKLADFLQWLERLSVMKLLVINDLATLNWNLNKKYLFELSSKQLPIIPSLCVTPEDLSTLAELMKELDSEQIVIKPVQSAGAWRTLRVNPDNIVEVDRDFAVWRREQDFLVQPFMPEIMQDGEWSLIFFDGEFSHAVLKSAKAGDFRVQSDHGGTVRSVAVSVNMQAQAQAILNALERMPCYARVDGVIRDGQFMLMELELLEPELFLEFDADAPQRFAQVIMRRLPRS
ncbi:hypothetical protein H8K52_12540 [Undibacterium seohonense]|uniref:Prokaryotic glutathione synthetase ATP-binding domain-containing protein n=1 Tax=Undibacterium seohonense TaxID=1344950 RepID=A0ABR6X5F0_9BURK|nr:hypothetical protein [Undibacterium seohonense]MBC3808174.1 hypothetical protein [Undibacterium seohonense]